MNTGGASNLPAAEKIHKMFLGTLEFAKWLKVLALVAEVIAALVAAFRIICPGLDWPGWASLSLASLVLIGTTLRFWGGSLIRFAERCRRVAIRAYGVAKDVSTFQLASLALDAPKAANFFANRLPTNTLDEYYECLNKPGVGRLRELYAHSSFYTWRLRRVYWRVCAVFSFLVLLIGFITIFSLAASPVDPTVAGRILDLVCSTVFVFFSVRAAVSAVNAYHGYHECRRICDALLSSDSLESMSELMIDYEIEIASSETIPTAVYMHMRDGLQRDWEELRAVLL